MHVAHDAQKLIRTSAILAPADRDELAPVQTQGIVVVEVDAVGGTVDSEGLRAAVDQ